jgi:hypothetical protein
MERYNVRNVSHVAEFMDKQQKSCLLKKEYILPSGTLIYLQGYEPQVLDDLLFKDKIDEKDILHNRQDVPPIYWYDDKGLKRKHYVDFYIISQNRCIEVKSIFTFMADTEKIYKKRDAAIDAGMLYDIYVYDSKELVMLI